MEQRQILEQLKERVLAKQTVLADIYRAHGDSTLHTYVNGWKLSPGQVDGILVQVVRDLLVPAYGNTVASEAAAQLQAVPLVSTIDHHGILNHPFFINSNLLFSLHDHLRYLICFTTAGVSLNNSSWPACLMVTENGSLRRWSLFPDSQKTRVVLAAPKVPEIGMQRVVEKLRAERPSLAPLAAEVLERGLAAGQPDFTRQASVMSSVLWSRIFPDAPQVVYVPLEQVASRMLLEKVHPHPESPLYKVLYTEQGWVLLEKYFQGSLGAFQSDKKGSFLFWGINDKGRRVHLLRHGDRLAGEGYGMRLEPGEVAACLDKQTLYPTTLVCFLVLLHSRLTALGGFNQVNWLTGIRDRVALLYRELGESEEAAAAEAAVTGNFAEANLAFLYGDGRLTKPAGLDLYGIAVGGLWQEFARLAKTLTLRESVDTLLPEIYRVITPGPDRDERLLGLSDEDAARLVGMEEKVRGSIKV